MLMLWLSKNGAFYSALMRLIGTFRMAISWLWSRLFRAESLDQAGVVRNSKDGHFMAADLLCIRCARKTSTVYPLRWPASQAAFAIGKYYSHMFLKYEKKNV